MGRLRFLYSRQRSQFVVQRFRLSQCFQEVGAGRARCSQQRGDSLQKAVWLEMERAQIYRQCFLAEVVRFIEGIEDQDQAVNGPCQAPGHNVGISTRSRLRGIVQREASMPEKGLDNGVLQFGSVVGHPCFQCLDRLIRVEERMADHQFCTIHKTLEAIGRLLPVIRANAARIAIIDDRGNDINVPVKPIYTLPPDGKPGTAIDPGAPSTDLGHRGLRCIVEVTGNGAQLINVSWVIGMVVETEINV